MAPRRIIQNARVRRRTDWARRDFNNTFTAGTVGSISLLSDWLTARGLSATMGSGYTIGRIILNCDVRLAAEREGTQIITVGLAIISGSLIATNLQPVAESNDYDFLWWRSFLATQSLRESSATPSFVRVVEPNMHFDIDSRTKRKLKEGDLLYMICEVGAGENATFVGGSSTLLMLP